MGTMVENPETYFSRWLPDRSLLLQQLESEAAHEGIPIVGPAVGRLLYLLARLCKPRQILELGTAIGYSAIFMGEACRHNQGQLITLENNPVMAERARVNIARAALSDVIEVRFQDALIGLTTLVQTTDMVFMDIEKKDYLTMLPMLEHIMQPNGLLVADNTAFNDAHAFNQAIHARPGWTSVNLYAFLPGHSPSYDGICMAMKT